MTKLANNPILSKVALSYEQFEEILEEIARFRFEKSNSRAESVKMLITHMNFAIKNTYSLNLNLNDQLRLSKQQELLKKSSFSDKEVEADRHEKNEKYHPLLTEREHSGSLDVSIREALQALKRNESIHSASASPIRSSKSTVHVMRNHVRTNSHKDVLAAKKPRGTLSSVQSPKGTKKLDLRLNLSSVLSSPAAPLTTSRLRRNVSYVKQADKSRLQDDVSDLTEFLETEKMVNREVVNVSVTLKKDLKNPFEISKKTTKSNTKMRDLPFSPIKNIKDSEIQTKTLIKNTILSPGEIDEANLTRSSPIDAKAKLMDIKHTLENFKLKHTKTISSVTKHKANLTIKREYQEFLCCQKKRSFSSQFVMSMIFTA